MAREPEPWRRGGAGGPWYAQIGGVQYRLAEPGATKEDARAVLRLKMVEAKAGKARPSVSLTVNEVIRLYGAHARAAAGRGEMTAACFLDYLFYLASADKAFGGKLLADLEPHHVQAWLDAHPKLPGRRAGWGPTSRHKAVTVVNLALNWARKMGHAAANPIEGMPRPAPGRREAAITPEQAGAVLEWIACPRFLDLVTALRETGCRPGEVYSLEADRVDLDAGTWRVVNKTRRKTGEATRTVYLSDRAAALTRRLIGENGPGLVFRNAEGGAWTSHAVAQRFERMRRALGYGPECVPYAFRHLYVTDLLSSGVPPATVAELVGHTDLKMIMRIYSKLRHRTEHLREAARSRR